VGADSKAYCWGYNNKGQLGNNTTTASNVPVQVAAGPATWVSISAGDLAACGIGNDSKAYCWGYNSVGGLGNNSMVDSKVPVQVNNGANTSGTWASLDGGTYSACGVGADSKAYCWGRNNNGQLGNNSTTSSSVPVQVNDGANSSGTWKNVVASYNGTCGIGSDDKAYCWGADNEGQLGNGTGASGSTGRATTPVLVQLPAGVLVQKLAADNQAFHFCALSTVDTAYCWGGNWEGQLGINSTTASNVPVTVQLGALAAGTPRMITVGNETSYMVSDFGTPTAPVYTADSPPTTATVGTAYAGYTFTASGSTPITFTKATGSLPTGLTLSTSGVLSGTPTTAGSFTFTVQAANGTSPNATTSSITITVSASGGGGGGSGGSSSTSEPTPTPTPTPTPSSVATTVPVVEPIPPGSNPNIPTSGVPLGASVYLVNGEPQTVVVRPDAPKDATAIDVVGDGFTMKLAGLGANGQPLGVTSDGALILQADRTAAVEGTGFLPNSDVNLYTFSTPRFLGTVKTDAAGNFKGTVPLPTDIPPGRHTLQSNGLAPDGAVRSLSLGVLLSADKVAGKARTVKATVYFDALSAELTSTAKASLKELVKGRAASATRTLVLGYVQDSGLTSNNQTLSSQRAKTIAAYLRSLGLKGAVVTRGDGVAREDGAAGRKAVVTIRYLR
jgi:alpha-tubulin suppressor-like RCC1 family protein/outer membrane protein OmpA-like peptidoglycan-associated protein